MHYSHAVREKASRTRVRERDVARIKCRTSVYKLFMLMVHQSDRLIAVGEVVIAFTRMQLRGFNDDATRLIAFILARDTCVMKKTMERENGRRGGERAAAEWTARDVMLVDG